MWKSIATIGTKPYGIVNGTRFTDNLRCYGQESAIYLLLIESLSVMPLFNFELGLVNCIAIDIDSRMKITYMCVHLVGKLSSAKYIFYVIVQCMKTSGRNISHSVPNHYYGIMLITLSHRKIVPKYDLLLFICTTPLRDEEKL